MKKLVSIFLSAVIICGLLLISACDRTEDVRKSDGKISVVTTIFPYYDFVRQLAGDKVDIRLLLSPGSDPHSYEPKPSDITAIENCDIFICNGGESDEWVDGVLSSIENKDVKVMKMMEYVPLRHEQSMDHDHEHDSHEDMDDDDEGHDHEEGEEYDEHVWTSMRNASVICDAIAETLEEMDPENKEIYQTNAENYKAKLSTLDQKYQETVDTDRQNTLIFADRFAFRYLVDDYGLNYYAAFSGCSAESEASFKTVTFLAGKLDELGIKTVLTIEKSDDRIAQTVIENTKKKDQKILELNSMQSITSDEIKNGVTYLSVMEDNLKVLKEALK